MHILDTRLPLLLQGIKRGLSKHHVSRCYQYLQVPKFSGDGTDARSIRAVAPEHSWRASRGTYLRCTTDNDALICCHYSGSGDDI